MKGVYFIILLFISLTCIANAWRTDYEVMALYEEWMQEHQKVYNGLGEKVDRFEIFKENLRYIEQHNSNPNKTYELGLNQFSDLTDEEFNSMFLSSNPIDFNDTIANDEFESDNYYVTEKTSDLSLPESIDWREKGAVLPIRYQGACGSCWAFSAVASVEALHKIYSGKLVAFSEQMLVDCVSPNNGCKSGRVDLAFQHMRIYGIASRADYPYTAKKGPCQPKPIVFKTDGYRFISPRNEQSLLRSAAIIVVSVTFKVGSKDFRQYKKGIFSGDCGNGNYHSMNVVGYGSENGKSYWILRNSWSQQWGENGYMRIARNVGSSYGQCGIAQWAAYPLKIGYVNEELLSTI